MKEILLSLYLLIYFIFIFFFWKESVILKMKRRWNAKLVFTTLDVMFEKNPPPNINFSL